MNIAAVYFVGLIVLIGIVMFLWSWIEDDSSMR